MRTAVHLHLYYISQLSEIISDLHNLDRAGGDYDLFVTMSVENPAVESEILKEFPTAKIWLTENRGYDIGPFIDFLHKIDFDKYDYVLKIHTKNQSKDDYTILNGNRMNDALWGAALREALLGSPERIGANLEILAENNKVGMVGSKYCLTSERESYQSLLAQIEAEMRNLGLKMPSKVAFVAGSMFMVRAELLKPFLKVKVGDFEPTDGKIKEGTKAHVYERLFGIAVLAQGMTIQAVTNHNYAWQFIVARIKRFFFQRKLTRSGKTIIKICKLPIYVGRLSCDKS